MKTTQQRLADEKEFHNHAFEDGKRKSVGKFYLINEKIEKNFDAIVSHSPKGKHILEYGCGMGDRLFELSKKGAVCYGIDISDYAITTLQSRADNQGLNVKYLVMNAEDLSFEDSKFDLIYGSGILHHLSLEKAFETISKKLKPSGKAVFIEPLGHNYIINRFRNKTPDLRTEDEHPLLMHDFALAKKYFEKLTIRYYFLTSLSLPLLLGKNIPGFLLSISNFVDDAIFALLPPMRKYAWQVLVEFENPKK
jgi:ubiquinone/menaquinone biosynthesis C-methylase UbiE